MGRLRMGISSVWASTAAWFDDSTPLPEVPIVEPPVFVKKFPEIPTLKSYRVHPYQSYWDKFPFRGVPNSITSKVSALELEKLVLSTNLTVHEKKRGLKVCSDLRFGAGAFQNVPLPPVIVPNAPSAFLHGEMLSDKIATWVKDGYVAGPFVNPPLPNFRSNSLMAISRKNSIRPCINLSAPEGASFNDNVVTNKLEKCHMATAKQFSYALLEAGYNAIFSKFDLKASNTKA